MTLEALRKKADSHIDCLAKLKTTTGRRRREDDEDLLTVRNFSLSDSSRIYKSKIYRGLSRKTQVFTKTKNHLIRDRMIHTGEVEATGLIIGEMLGLNTDLISAASKMHDVGHVPFGHQGEEFLAKAMGKKDFCHEKMGPVIMQHIERAGKGANLCWETMNAGMRHSGNLWLPTMSEEAKVVNLADKTYIFHDYGDIKERLGFTVSPELMKCMNEFGLTQRERTTTMISAIIVESAECGSVSFSQSGWAKKFRHLRNLMYEVYVRVTCQDVEPLMAPVLKFLEGLKTGNPFLLLALMTDEDVLDLHGKVIGIELLKQYAIWEIIPHVAAIGDVDMCNPDLDW